MQRASADKSLLSSHVETEKKCLLESDDMKSQIEEWAPKFNAIGIDSQLLEATFPRGVDFSQLYLHCLRFKGVCKRTAMEESWQLSCLADEKTAMEFFQEQINSDSSLFFSDAFGRMPIHYMAFAGHVNVIEKLRHAGQPVDIENVNGLNMLHYAALSGVCETIRYMLWNFPEMAQKTNDDGETLLHFASVSGKKDAIALILKLYPELVNKKDKQGRLFVHYVAASGDIDSIAFVMRYFPHMINKVDKLGRTFLHHVAMSSSIDSILFVIDKRPNLTNIMDREGKNFLFHIMQPGSNAADCFKLITMKYPFMTARLSAKTMFNVTLESAASMNYADASPADIRHKILMEITINLLSLDASEELNKDSLRYLEAFGDQWIKYLLDDDRYDVAKLHSLVEGNQLKYFPRELRKKLNDIELFLSLKKIKTDGLEISYALLSEIMKAADKIISRLFMTSHQNGFFTFHPSSQLMRALSYYMDRLKKAENYLETGEEKTRQAIIALSVLMNDCQMVRQSELTRRVDQIVTRKIMSTSTMAALRPSSSVVEGISITPENYLMHLQEMKKQFAVLHLSADTTRIMNDTIFVGLEHLMARQDLIIKTVIQHPGCLYYLADHLPLHAEAVAVSDAERFKKSLNHMIVGVIGAFYTCLSAGRLPGFFDKLATGFCWDGRVTDTLNWTAQFADLKSINQLMGEWVENYNAYAAIMWDHENEGDVSLKSMTDFIMQRYADVLCLFDAEYAVEGRITRSIVERYLQDSLLLEKEKNLGTLLMSRFHRR